MIKALKNKKGFTLMELIVVLIIIAVLMAALLPSLIGWINEARESALRVDGRTALLAMQSTVTQARGVDRWSTATSTPFNLANFLSTPRQLISNDLAFRELMVDANIFGNNAGYVAGTTFRGAAGAFTGVVGVYVTPVTGNLIGIQISNNVRPTRDVDGIGGGLLLIGTNLNNGVVVAATTDAVT